MDSISGPCQEIWAVMQTLPERFLLLARPPPRGPAVTHIIPNRAFLEHIVLGGAGGAEHWEDRCGFLQMDAQEPGRSEDSREPGCQGTAGEQVQQESQQKL